MQRKVYVADDEKNIRDLIYAFLKNEGFIVSLFDNGDDLFEAFLAEPCDLVIIDVMMPGTDGLIISSRLRAISSVPIIIVSARDTDIDKIAGITMGSDDYLAKPFSPMELVARVKALFRRASYSAVTAIKTEDVISFLDVSINLSTREAKAGNGRIDLTPTEFSLVKYFIENKDRAISREELLKNVWNFDFEVDTRATDDVIKRLRKKLSMCGSQVLIESVWGFGFKLGGS